MVFVLALHGVDQVLDEAVPAVVAEERCHGVSADRTRPTRLPSDVTLRLSAQCTRKEVAQTNH